MPKATTATQTSTAQSPLPSSSAGLSSSYFNGWLDKFEAGFRAMLHRHEVQLREYFLKHAKDLAKCSAQQFEIVMRRLAPLGVGFHMKDMLKKTREVGFGNMKPFLALQPGLTAAAWYKTPSQAKAHLNSDKPTALLIGGSIIKKRPSKMHEKEFRRAFSGCRPQGNIIPPQRQNDPRPRPKPKYYSPVAMAYDGQSVVVTFRLGSSEFKGRFTPAQAKRFCLFVKPLTSAKRKK